MKPASASSSGHAPRNRCAVLGVDDRGVPSAPDGRRALAGASCGSPLRSDGWLGQAARYCFGDPMDTAALVTRLLDVIESDIAAATQRGRGGRQQAVRRGDPAQVRPVGGGRRDQQRDRESAVARRDPRHQALLRTAGRPASRDQRIASSWPRTSPARCACRASPGPGSTISTICSATRTPATASASRTTSPSSRRSLRCRTRDRIGLARSPALQPRERVLAEPQHQADDRHA